MRARKATAAPEPQPLRSIPDQIRELADANFALQIIGKPMAFDTDVIGEPLVYMAYRNGCSAVECAPTMGRVSPNDWPSFADAMGKIGALFKYERRTKGHDVIVWRTLPQQEGEKVYFRCAFTSSRKLAVVKAAVGADKAA